MSTSPANPRLTYLLASVLGVIGAVLGFIATGFAAATLLGLGGMSDREGYRAMIAFASFAPFGGLVGLLAGIAFVLRWRGGYRGFATLTIRTILVAVALAAIVGLGVWAWVVAEDDILAKNSPTPQLQFEIGLPPGTTLPASGAEVELDTDKNTMPAAYLRRGNDGDRQILSGAVLLHFRTSSRILVLRVPDEPDRLFVLKLHSDPPGSAAFGPWQWVDHIADQKDGGLRWGEKGDGYQARYRVDRAD